jgi:hypothetical protein
MAAELGLKQQMEALADRIKNQVPALKTVVGLEELDDVVEQVPLLPAAVVVYSGDYPERVGSGLTEHPGQKVIRYWSVLLILELTQGPGEAMDLVEAVRDAGLGWRICRGVGFLALSGLKFVTKFDRTRVVYEVRFTSMIAQRSAA